MIDCQMKAPSMQVRRFSGKHPHSHSREIAMQAIYQQTTVYQDLKKILRFEWLNTAPQKGVLEYASQLICTAETLEEEALAAIEKLAHKDMTQISIVVRSILQIGYVELRQEIISPAIIIDDLLQLVRKYDGDQSVAFVNGILSAMQEQLRPEGGVKEGHGKEEYVKEGYVKDGDVREGHVKEGDVKERHVKEGDVKNGDVKTET